VFDKNHILGSDRIGHISVGIVIAKYNFILLILFIYIDRVTRTGRLKDISFNCWNTVYVMINDIF